MNERTVAILTHKEKNIGRHMRNDKWSEEGAGILHGFQKKNDGGELGMMDGWNNG